MPDSRKEEIDQRTGEIRQIMDEQGRELPDPTPLEVPVGFKRPETLAEQVRRLVRSEHFNAEREALGEETFDEADDFDVDDDFDPSTPYEVFFDPVLNREVSPDEFQRNAEGYKKRYLQAQEEFFSKVDADNILAENLYRKAKQTQKGGEGENPPRKAEPEPEPS